MDWDVWDQTGVFQEDQAGGAVSSRIYEIQSSWGNTRVLVYYTQKASHGRADICYMRDTHAVDVYIFKSVL